MPDGVERLCKVKREDVDVRGRDDRYFSFYPSIFAIYTDITRLCLRPVVFLFTYLSAVFRLLLFAAYISYVI